MTGSVLMLEVPEAEPAVHSHRSRLDPVTRFGVPAHVTALFPFAPSTDLRPEMLATLAEVTAHHQPIDVTFSRTSWFGEDVLYLAPDDPGPFQRLTTDLAAAFPDYPPYEGQFDDPTPHLTVGQGDDLAGLRAAERAILASLPVRGRIERLSLLVEADDGYWSRVTTFPLGAPR